MLKKVHGLLIPGRPVLLRECETSHEVISSNHVQPEAVGALVKGIIGRGKKTEEGEGHGVGRTKGVLQKKVTKSWARPEFTRSEEGGRGLGKLRGNLWYAGKGGSC